MVGGSLQVLRLLPPLKLVAMNDDIHVAEILLKVALNTINQIKSNQNGHFITSHTSGFVSLCDVAMRNPFWQNKSTIVCIYWSIWFWFLVFNATFSNMSATFFIMATSFSGGGSRSTQREPPPMGKQLVNFITCGCESSAPFFVIYKAGCEPTPYWW